MTKRDAFFQFLQPQYLYYAAIFFAALTALIVTMIYFYLYIRKRNFRMVDRVNEQINTWIGQALMDNELPEIVLTPELQQYLRKKRNREFVIDSLIKTRKNLRGAAAKSLVDLYRLLDLKKDSVARFKSVVWHQKAKGIYELYMMDEDVEMLDIYKYTNSANEYVRMEAQIAIVGFWGFEGLSFLDTLEQPLTEWQQLKLFEQLSTLDTVTMDRLPLWLRSGNHYVVQFALKLADVYRQMDVHDIVVTCLESPQEKLRFQAIKTLGRIAGGETAAILIARYPEETKDNKKSILQQLKEIGDASCRPFLDRVFREEEEELKLDAARALATIHPGTDALGGFSLDTTLASISKQVQFERGR